MVIKNLFKNLPPGDTNIEGDGKGRRCSSFSFVFLVGRDFREPAEIVSFHFFQQFKVSRVVVGSAVLGAPCLITVFDQNGDSRPARARNSIFGLSPGFSHQDGS